MSPNLWSRATLIFKGIKTNWFPKGAVIKCCDVYPIQGMNNLAASFSKKFFLFYKLCKYFPPSGIPLNDENNKLN